MRISAIGCCLTDYVYGNVSYGSDAFKTYLSRNPADGGLTPGGLVFSEDLERFAGKPFPEVLSELTDGAEPDAVNLGGPAIVALVNAVQILRAPGMVPGCGSVETAFYGAIGTDEVGKRTRAFITPLPILDVFLELEGMPSSSTVVLADPAANGGRGERTFVNTMGASGEYSPDDLPDEFFDSDIVLFGGTALVPRIHDGLSGLLREAKRRGAVTVVGTVFDFRNEKRFPGGCWPLGDGNRYADIDLLVTDAHEARRLTGAGELDDAVRIFIDRGAGSVVATDGVQDLRAWSGGAVFSPLEAARFPISREVSSMLENDPSLSGDTTGCGDNFLGGLTASLALQLLKNGGTTKPDLREAIAWGTASGGFACFYAGGMYREKEPGEKVRKLIPLVDAYRLRTGL